MIVVKMSLYYAFDIVYFISTSDVCWILHRELCVKLKLVICNQILHSESHSLQITNFVDTLVSRDCVKLLTIDALST